MVALAQTAQRQQRLALAAAPLAFQVHIKRFHSDTCFPDSLMGRPNFLHFGRTDRGVICAQAESGFIKVRAVFNSALVSHVGNAAAWDGQARELVSGYERGSVESRVR